MPIGSVSATWHGPDTSHGPWSIFSPRCARMTSLVARMRGEPESTVDATGMMASHPRTADLIQQTVAATAVNVSISCYEGRAEYLTVVHGLLFGDNPR